MSVKICKVLYLGDGAVFFRACDLAGIPPTVRQWKKWQKREGLARKREAEARKGLAA